MLIEVRSVFPRRRWNNILDLSLIDYGKLHPLSARIELMIRLCPNCARKLAVFDRYFCSDCGSKLPAKISAGGQVTTILQGDTND